MMEHIESLLKGLSHEAKAEDQLLTITEAAKLLNLSVATIYSKVSQNEIPCARKAKSFTSRRTN